MSINDIHLFSARKDLLHCPSGDSPSSAAVGVVILQLLLCLSKAPNVRVRFGQHFSFSLFFSLSVTPSSFPSSASRQIGFPWHSFIVFVGVGPTSSHSKEQLLFWHSLIDPWQTRAVV